jgi:hypothetical protein
MKKIFIILISLISVNLAQNWTSVKETNVWVGTAVNLGVDIFTNGYGNHIIVQRQNGNDYELKYFRVNVNGTATDSTTIESTSVVSPCITGDASILYIVYGKNNEVTAKYSTDGGDNWSYIGSNPQNSNASWIESVMSNGILHVTYQVSNSSLYRNFTSNAWSEQYTVSSCENGIYPRITAWYDANDDKVYFIYKKLYTSDIKWREFNVATSSWTSDPRLAISMVGSSPAGIAVTDTRITFYYNFFIDPYWYIQWIIKDKSNNYLETCFEYNPDETYPRTLYSTITSNYDAHVPLWLNFYYDEELFPGIYHSNGYDCNTNLIYWNNNQEQQNVNFINCSSSSNDVYVIWQDSYIGQNLRLIYDDQNPLAPQGLAVEIYSVENENHPKLTWTLNNEPDVYINENAYDIQRRISINGGAWSAWSHIAYRNGDQSYYIDWSIGNC